MDAIIPNHGSEQHMYNTAVIIIAGIIFVQTLYENIQWTNFEPVSAHVHAAWCKNNLSNLLALN